MVFQKKQNLNKIIDRNEEALHRHIIKQLIEKNMNIELIDFNDWKTFILRIKLIFHYSLLYKTFFAYRKKNYNIQVFLKHSFAHFRVFDTCTISKKIFF